MKPDTEIPLRSGRKVPAMGLGTWQLTDDTVGTVLEALKRGYRLIDTSGDYGTQAGIGEAVARSGINRVDLYIVTKVEETDDAYDAAQRNLNELGMEFVNLILIHRPPRSGAGEALWEGLMRARDDGMCKDIGVSNYSRALMDKLIATFGEVPVVNQIEWSPFGHSADMLDYAGEHDVVIQAYSPLTRTERLDDETLTDIAAKHGKTPAQVLIRWNLQLGTVPLPKANQSKHLEENMDIWDFSLDQADMRTLNGLNEHYSSLGALPYN